MRLSKLFSIQQAKKSNSKWGLGLLRGWRWKYTLGKLNWPYCNSLQCSTQDLILPPQCLFRQVPIIILKMLLVHPTLAFNRKKFRQNVLDFFYHIFWTNLKKKRNLLYIYLYIHFIRASLSWIKNHRIKFFLLPP